MATVRSIRAPHGSTSSTRTGISRARTPAVKPAWRPASCRLLQDGEVAWIPGVDKHEELLRTVRVLDDAEYRVVDVREPIQSQVPSDVELRDQVAVLEHVDRGGHAAARAPEAGHEGEAVVVVDVARHRARRQRETGHVTSSRSV